MVTIRLLLYLLFTTCLNISAQAAQLTLELNKNTVELGKYLNVTLIYEGEDNPGNINLTPWHKDFFVDAEEAVAIIGAEHKVHLRYPARLYPLHAGKLTLRAIAHGSTYSKPIEIKAIASVREGIDTTPIWQPMPEKLWVDQPLHLRIDMPLFHRSNISAAEDFESADFEVHPLPKIHGEQRTPDGRELPIDRFQWLLFAPRAGLHFVQAPRLEQRGRSRLRYYLVGQNIEVKPLPSYLPSTLVVGKPHIDSHIDWQVIPAQWVVKVSHQGRLPNEIYGLRKQLAELSRRPIDQIKIQTIRSIGIGDKPAEQIYRIDLPEYQAPASLIPWMEPPTIKLAYFETSDDFNKTRLQYVQHVLPSAWQLPISWQYLLIVLAVIAVLIIARWLQLQLRKNQMKYLRRQRLENAPNIQAKRHLLLDDGNKQYHSLSEWAGKNKLRQISAAKMNSACFSRPDKNNL